MLIHQQNRTRPLLRLLWPIVGLLVLTLSGVYLLSSSSSSKDTMTASTSYPLIWDAEEVQKDHFISKNGALLSGAQTQTTEAARSGRYSSLLPQSDKTQYGMTYLLKGFQPGQLYKASVWRKKNQYDIRSYLVVEGEKGSGIYWSTDRVSKQEPGGWRKIELLFMIPENYEGKQMKIYVFSNGQGKTYWDDFRIDQIENGDSVNGFVARRIDLKIKDKAYQKLERKRQKALGKGILRTEEDSWVKGLLKDSSEEMSIRLRLKGDWLDHLTSNKWSLRVKVKDPNAWNRLKEFSFHTPRARYYVLEWLLHQFWEREDVLTTRYDFVQLYLNDQPLGAYAYEEHFDKQLVEYRQRREGPILKFSEDALWDARLRQYKNGGLSNRDKPAIAEMINAEVQVFKEQRTLQSSSLHRAFELASELLTDYQLGRRGAEEVFDLKRTARYYAIADILGAHHGLIWHNQRFYFNPVTSRIEPIGYDGFSNRPRQGALLLGKEMIENGSSNDVAAMKRLFDNEQFIEHYMNELLRLSSEAYMEQFLDEHWLGVEARLDFLRSEFPNIKTDRERILRRAGQVRRKLLPYNDHSIKAYWRNKGEGQRILEISSTHELPLKIVGLGNQAQTLTRKLEESIPLPPYYMGQSRTTRELEAPDAAYRYLFYQPYGVDTLFSSPISNWPRPRFNQKVSEQLAANLLQCVLPYEQIGNQIQIQSGQYTLRESVHFPAGLEIHIPAGTEINLLDRAAWVSRSPIFINGTADSPVIIRSEDRSAKGFTVLETDKTSKIRYCTFDGFNTWQNGPVSLTGAVTFYEADVEIDHCLIRNNQCEDALNLVRSTFEIEQLHIQNAPSDGFDADFCKGNISYSEVENTGNDGYDFSGSQIKVYRCNFQQCGDKGVSVGEESNVELEGIRIDSATIGIVSKDLSYVRVRWAALKNCNQGFAAYQKKPEFGHSSIVVDHYEAEDVRILHTIATRCTLELKNRVIIGE